LPVNREGLNRLDAEGELFVEGVLGSYTVEGSVIGGSGGRDEGGSCTGERGLTRRGLEVGEGCDVCWSVLLRGGEELVVDCDQRFMLAWPSLTSPMPSAAPLAALDGRLAVGGGVARLWGGLDADNSGFVFTAAEAAASLSESEADRLTVTTDDDDTEPLRDDWDCGWPWCGPSFSLVCIFMLFGCVVASANLRVSGQASG
jgi:hypothetical protein